MEQKKVQRYAVLRMFMAAYLGASILLSNASAGPHPCPENEILLQDPVREGVKRMPPKSEMMDKLYGEQTSVMVYERLQELDPEFNELVQRIAYDMFWGRKGLSVREKSLATVASLIALQRAEQTKIHLNGLLNSGGSAAEITSAFKHMEKFAGEESARNGRLALKDVAATRRLKLEDSEMVSISARDRSIIALASYVAQGKQDLVKIAIKDFLGNGGSVQDVSNILIHLTVYCGFPSSAEAFSSLREVAQHSENEFYEIAERVIRIYAVRPGLNSRDKALITMASLVALNRVSQLSQYLNELSALGASSAEIRATFGDASTIARDQSLIALAQATSRGDLTLVEISMREFMKHGGTASDVRSLLIHLTPYNGFPASMNGFAILNKMGLR